MHRFFAERTGDHAAALLPQEESHALKVLRMREGDACQALLEGGLFRARITALAPRVTVALEEALPSPEPSVHLTLYQGIPKGEKMDYIVQKCTEAGVARIVPVEMSRCVARWDGRDAEKKRLRYQRIAQEAAKQAGRAVTPSIAAPVAFSALPALMAGHALALVPWEEAEDWGVRAYLQGQTDIALLIGPEGGISREEMAALAAAGARSVTLGPRIFRTETAGLAALISILTCTGDMGL